jgi:hypothetical protein
MKVNKFSISDLKQIIKRQNKHGNLFKEMDGNLYDFAPDPFQISEHKKKRNS